jgi:Ca-activated chloride channel homolog
MEVSLTAPAEVAAGAEFEVSWTGPDAPNDYLTIVPVGAGDGEYGDYRYTREGATLRLTAPDAPGDYEVRYQNAQGVFARRPITVR